MVADGRAAGSAGQPTVDEEGRTLDFHALRHTAATWLDEMGVDASVVQAILGHRTGAMTTDLYQHARRRRLAAAMEKLPELPKLQATGTDPCHNLAKNVSAHGHACQPLAIDTPSEGAENAFSVPDRWPSG